MNEKRQLIKFICEELDRLDDQIKAVTDRIFESALDSNSDTNSVNIDLGRMMTLTDEYDHYVKRLKELNK